MPSRRKRRIRTAMADLNVSHQTVVNALRTIATVADDAEVEGEPVPLVLEEPAYPDEDFEGYLSCEHPDVAAMC